jgi:kynurenine formamidase
MRAHDAHQAGGGIHAGFGLGRGAEVKMKRGLPLLLLVGAIGCGQPQPPPQPAGLPSGAIVDLSHAYDASTIFWPTAERFQLTTVADGVTAGGYYYAANTFATSEHGGTHLDAPLHFAAGKWAADEIPLERLVGPAVVVDVSAAAARDGDYQVTSADLEAWERTHGQIPDGAILLLRTDFSKRWPDAAAYLGTAERGAEAVAKLHFPGLHPDAARWLASARNIHALGIDTASIDYGQSTMFESHRALYEKNIPGLENLTNLDRLPATGATVVALPMKIAKGSGGPLRAIAMLPSAR